MKYTEKQLWAFVNRADTHEKIAVAEEFLTNLEGLDIELYDKLMETLSMISRELYNPKW